MLDRGGNLVEFSDSFASMLGYEREELAGAHISKWNASVPSEALDKWLSSFQIGSTDRLVTQHRRSDGQLIDVEITMAGVQVAGLEWVYCAARDITERKRLRAMIDEALARAEERERFLRELTDNLPLRIAYFDAELRFRFVNETLCRRLGLAREQILGRTARELVGEPAPAAVADGLHVALGGQPVRFEFEETHGGEVAMIERHFVPDVADDGKVSGLYVVSADVTERYAQQRRLEVALAERETLLREVYHRVENNLQVVQSLLNLQRRALPEGDARAALDDSAQRVRAMALVHEKLYQSGTLSAVPLHDYIRDLLRQVGLAAGARVRGIELVARVDEVDAALDLAVPFGLLVTELVSNSLKHGFPNGRAGVVRVQLAREKDVLCLEVTDNGVGLPAGFDVLRIRSMGLKLAVTLAAQLGGALRAEGQGGAVFLAELPRLG